MDISCFLLWEETDRSLGVQTSLCMPDTLHHLFAPLPLPVISFGMETLNHRGLHAWSVSPGEVKDMCCLSLSSFPSHLTDVYFYPSVVWDPTCSWDIQSGHSEQQGKHLSYTFNFPWYISDPSGEDEGTAEFMAGVGTFLEASILWNCIPTCYIVCNSHVLEVGAF